MCLKRWDGSPWGRFRSKSEATWGTASTDAAHGGTLFLYEDGDMPPCVQAVLLRFLQEGTFERLGSVAPISADVRILAATHQNLQQAVAEGRFREDLFYRLNTLHIHVPALRDRDQDKLQLAAFFLHDCCRHLGLQPRYFSTEAKQSIMNHAWPGNVREVRNRILQALVLCDSFELQAADMAPDNPINDPVPGRKHPRSLADHPRKAEPDAIHNALLASKACVQEAANLPGISRAQFYRPTKDRRFIPDNYSLSDYGSPH